MGRNKIEIKKIECATKRRMTFSKRSHGLIKKAKELSVLCGIDVALVIISPAGKVQHFSNQPGIEHVIERFKANIQEGNEDGMCSGNKEKCKGGCCESHLMESRDPTLLTQQIRIGQVYGTSGTNPAPGMQSTRTHSPLQELHLLEASQDREQVQMLGVPFAEVGEPSSLQHTQEGNESLVCSDLMDELPSSSEFENFLELEIENFLESEIPPSSSEQIDNGPLSTNPASGVQSAYWNMPMQQHQVWEMEAHQDRERVQMQIDPFVEPGYPSLIEVPIPRQYLSSEVRGPYQVSDDMRGPLAGGCETEMHFASGVQVQPCLSLWELAAGGEIGSVADLVIDSRWSADELREMSHIS